MACRNSTESTTLTRHTHTRTNTSSHAHTHANIRGSVTILNYVSVLMAQTRMQGSKAAAFLFTHATSLTNPEACLLIFNNAAYFMSFAFIGVRGRRICHRRGVEQSLCVLEGQGGSKASIKAN